MCSIDQSSSFRPPPSFLTHGENACHRLETLAALKGETEKTAGIEGDEWIRKQASLGS